MPLPEDPPNARRDALPNYSIFEHNRERDAAFLLLWDEVRAGRVEVRVEQTVSGSPEDLEEFARELKYGSLDPARAVDFKAGALLAEELERMPRVGPGGYNPLLLELKRELEEARNTITALCEEAAKVQEELVRERNRADHADALRGQLGRRSTRLRLIQDAIGIPDDVLDDYALLRRSQLPEPR